MVQVLKAAEAYFKFLHKLCKITATAKIISEPAEYNKNGHTGNKHKI